MHHRPAPRIVATLALLAVALGLGGAAPTAAVAAEGAPPGDARGDLHPRSDLGLGLAVTRDGNGPFTPSDGPGGDTGPTNGVVRTLDAVTYRVTVSSQDGPSHGTRFTVSAPAGTRWDAVPALCTGPGSALAGSELTCDLGTVPEGEVKAVPVVLDVSDELRNGDRIAVHASVVADGTDGPTKDAPEVTVSAAPRYDLSKSLVASQIRTDVAGPDGRPGLQFVYPVTVDWRPLVAGQGLLGFERSNGTMSFTDDVSRILGDLPTDAVLWNGDRPACGPNDAASPERFWTLPGGSGGGPAAVADSGTFRCEQAGPGAEVQVVVDGVVTDASRMPTRTLAGGDVPAGLTGMVVSGYLAFWVPNPPTGTSVESVNTYSALVAPSVSGATNYPGEGEPTADNTARRNVFQDGPGISVKHLFRVTDDAGHVTRASAQQGDPWTTPGQRHRSDVGITNPGLSPFHDAVLCDTFDRRTQRLTAVAGRTAWTTGLGKARVQYAAYGMTSPDEGQRHADCSDGSGPWFDDPADVPGGVDAVGAVRAVGDVPAADSAALHSYVTIRSVPNGTRAYDFGHVVFGVEYPGWVHDVWSDPALGAGGLSDSVLVTQDLARVTKKVVDPGYDADDTPDATQSVLAGHTLEYAVSPSVTNGKATGGAVPVTVTDVLPVDTTYVSGSGSRTPQVDTVTADDGTARERLTWDLGAVTPNRAIAPITYSVRVSNTSAAEAITNHAVVSSPADASSEDLRSAERAVRVVTAGGVVVEESAVHPVVLRGDQLGWDLRYRNTDATAVSSTDLIDVLPRTGVSGSSFHGTAHLAAGVPTDPADREQATYTAADADSVDPDPSQPSNQPGGATTWCAESAFGTDGCPTSFSDVTAVRVQHGAPVAPGGAVTHRLTLVTDGEQDGDVYVNRFELHAGDLDLPALSNTAAVRVVAGAIGDRVWDDEDGNGLQDPGEPGVPEVPVHLLGTDDRGDAVDRTSRTDRAGHYRFDGLRPGAYTLTFTAPADTASTREHVGEDPTRDSDVAADGVTPTITLAERTDAEGHRSGVDRTDDVDAGLVHTGTGTPGGGGGTGGGPGPGGGSGSGGGAGSGGGSTPGGGTTPGGTGTESPHGTGPVPGSDAAHPARQSHGALAFTGAAGLVTMATSATVVLVAGLLLRRAGRRGTRRR